MGGFHENSHYDITTTSCDLNNYQQNEDGLHQQNGQKGQQEHRHHLVKCPCHHQHLTTRNWKIRVFSARCSSISIIVLLLSLTLAFQVTISSCSPLRASNDGNFYPRSYLQQHHQHQSRFQRHLKPNLLQDNLGDNIMTNMDSSASLSIVSPLDVLRQNLLLEIHRQRLRHAKTKQVESNREFLEKIG